MKKTEILMKKPAYLGLSMLEINKILMYEFWYYYIKSKYGKKAKLCYMGTDSFIAYIKTDNIYRNIADDVETRFDISNYELECNPIERPLCKGKKIKIHWMNERWIRWMNHDKICRIKSRILWLLNRWR